MFVFSFTLLVCFFYSVFIIFSKISRDKELFKLRDEFAADLKEKGNNK